MVYEKLELFSGFKNNNSSFLDMIVSSVNKYTTTNILGHTIAGIQNTTVTGYKCEYVMREILSTRPDVLYFAHFHFYVTINYYGTGNFIVIVDRFEE